MEKVIYRNLSKEDYEPIKKLIGEAFGFNEFIKDEELLDMVLSNYLRECILESSFSKVAQKDNKVIGIILGNAQKYKNRLENYALNLESSKSDLIMSNNENAKLLKEFSNIIDVYKDLIKGKKSNFQGCIQY
jgi:hypothetical protein